MIDCFHCVPELVTRSSFNSYGMYAGDQFKCCVVQLTSFFIAVFFVVNSKILWKTILKL